MSWIRFRKGSAGVAALVLGCVAGHVGAETLVVRSTGPSAKSYPPGKAIPDTAKITLKANDQVVLLDGRGTRTLKGPGSFSPLANSSATASAGSTLGALVAQRGDRRARIGAVRSITAGPARSPNIWFVDIDRSTTVCVADPQAVTLWRAGMPKPVSVTLTGSDAKPYTLNWTKDRSTMPWPAALPIASGQSYQIRHDGAAQPTAVRFVVLGTALSGLEDLASTLIQNGCSAQLDLLIDTVALPDPTASGG
ncbi:MAG: hypothetical protein JWM38_1702 [Sphingomonas bacterium]|nr:hypothetical protein [Sphingomonas bacterium]